MKKVKMKGKTVDAAVNAALEVLGRKKEEVEVRVLSEGKEGVLGVFGGEEAEVEVQTKETVGEKGRELLQETLDKMGFMTLVSLAKEEEETVYLDIKGEDMGRIIGKEGTTLDALQYLIGMMLTREHDRRIRVVADAGGYRKRRARRLERVAEEAAVEVERTGREVALSPMPAADRRAIHLALKGNPKVTSFSLGERGERHIVVSPKGAAEEAVEEGEKAEHPRET